MKKNFILGVGCQKGGTTWLHSQLNKSDCVDMGFTKEYHVFDALYVPACSRFLNEKLALLKHFAHDFQWLSKNPFFYKHLGFYLDTRSYFDYFDYLWHKQKQISTVGDITPSYSALPVTALQAIKSELESRGFNVKVVFLMRDPIERCWSMIRMERRNRLRNNPSAPVPDEIAMLENSFANTQCEIRTRYENTINNLECVFDKENIFYSLYETLFESTTIDNLKKFLELDDFRPDINHKTNVSRKNDTCLELDSDLASKIFNHYRQTYDFCASRFGAKEHWPGWKYS